MEERKRMTAAQNAGGAITADQDGLEEHGEEGRKRLRQHYAGRSPSKRTVEKSKYGVMGIRPARLCTLTNV